MFSTKIVNTASLARAGRASRVGTRAGRVFKVVRLIRIIKLYKSAQEQKQKVTNQFEQELEKKKKKIQEKYKLVNMENEIFQNNNNQTINKDNHKNNKNKEVNKNQEQQQNIKTQQNAIELQKNQSENELNNIYETNLKESRVSKKLSDLTTKRVIIIVLLLLFIMPLFSADYFYDLPASLDFQIEQFLLMTYQKTCTHEDIKQSFDNIIILMSNLDNPLIYFKTPFQFTNFYKDQNFESLRLQEKIPYAIYFDVNLYSQSHPEDIDTIYYLKGLSNDELYFEAFLSSRKTAFFASALSLGRTVFVCIVLTMAALLFSKDVNDLALRPIERMIEKVNQIARNPISVKDQELIMNLDDQYETTIIENAIIKIGTLLALGFGEAGSEIIGSNMAKLGDIDPMIPGKKKYAIYGICDIRNFTDATEVLQEDVMLFVNNIGEIVHSMVDRYMGAANKNIGDAFLLVWKIPEDKYSFVSDNIIKYEDYEYLSMYADFSLISFMKIHCKLNREPKILAYRSDKRLNRRMPNYKVKIGFGLHIGWSIEGAIGSEFKIDASYLSPNVTMANRLEAATKSYGVPILISSDIHDLFSERKWDLAVKLFEEAILLKPEDCPTKNKLKFIREYNGICPKDWNGHYVFNE
ncbi:hypothetical protein IMG5_048380 [Ichthyophthirius multifiliis]|uniref:Guanylate cyclase domain-containing protein n=1 Tax=Ichthyophthirius multifiliis TaxID=5932 RepID=G0QMG1_ICHMU|nr:hypothetical protein IMG5_048380 [Ichthyophthirius multifiliis]EGR33596.1 hypothetical protein IMG5_048380 [Ichthyophthirius multifiliis]|eukprot:XP_004037582.1 hypothetical protein IMG5_048380 [Ichthyophthirius multifiliis]